MSLCLTLFSLRKNSISSYSCYTETVTILIMGCHSVAWQHIVLYLAVAILGNIYTDGENIRKKVSLCMKSQLLISNSVYRTVV